jgi:hypothetical protein
MTFAHYELAAGSSIHEHAHPEEEDYEVIEGELEVTLDGTSQIVKPGRWHRAREQPSFGQSFDASLVGGLFSPGTSEAYSNCGSFSGGTQSRMDRASPGVLSMRPLRSKVLIIS